MRRIHSFFKDGADGERVAQVVIEESAPALDQALRLLGKLLLMAMLAFVLASSCCFSGWLVPVGVLLLAISSGWLDVIRVECGRGRFFPGNALNMCGSVLFHWLWIFPTTGVLLALCNYGPFTSLHLDRSEQIWSTIKMVFIPLALMLLGRSVEPYTFKRARTDVLRAEMLVRQLLANKANKTSVANDVPPLLDVDVVPFYRLGSVMSVLHDTVASYDATDKLKVELTKTKESRRRSFLSVVYAPFRSLAGEVLLWESRDYLLYAVVGFYLALVYVGSLYVPIAPIAPLAIAMPFFGPKSRAGRGLRALEEDIRLAQGAAVQEKGGLEPKEKLEDLLLGINWPMMIYISANHLTALYALLVFFFLGGVCPLFGNGVPMMWQTCVWAGVVYVLSGLGITGGVHRLWSHRSYKAALPLRVLLMLFNSCANQGTIFHWARDHRVHHLYSDTVADPHNALNGFFYCHVGWLVTKKHPAVAAAGRGVNMSDLLSDPVVMFQKRMDPFWNLLWCFALPAFPALLWGDSLWNGFLLAGVLRYVLVLNASWAVNSVVHAYGGRPYNASHRTTENGWVSLFALGEGWHNWHHAFDYDYTTAELGPLSQFNPTRVFIDAMALLGLVWDRKRAINVWETRKVRWEKTNGRPVCESIEGPPLFKQRVITFGPHNYGAEDHEKLDSSKQD